MSAELIAIIIGTVVLCAEWFVGCIVVVRRLDTMADRLDERLAAQIDAL